MRVKAQNRRGSVLITVAAFMFVFMMMIAFAVDYGYLLVVRTDLQRCADAAALAAVRDLAPDSTGDQTGAEDAARATAREYANSNVRSTQESLTIPDNDIEVGRYDRATINSGTVTLLNGGMLDAVRVTLRRDGNINSAVPLFFGRVFGARRADVVVAATAVLRPVKVMVPGDGVLPIAVDIDEWNATDPGGEFVMYGDGRFEDQYGNTRAGNWGTVDIGAPGNSTSDLTDQIENGLRQSDLEDLASQLDLYGDPRLPNDTELRAPLWVQGETGLSAGLSGALDGVVEATRMIPIIDQLESGNGNTAEYHIVSWGVVKVTEVDLHGSKASKHVTIEKIYDYDGKLKPNNDLSDASNLIEGAFAAAGLVE